MGVGGWIAVICAVGFVIWMIAGYIRAKNADYSRYTRKNSNPYYTPKNTQYNHPKCIIVGVNFPGSYKRYHYLSNEIVSIGSTVRVRAGSEIKSAIVVTCKEYQENETLPYPYGLLGSIIAYEKPTPQAKKHPKCIVLGVNFTSSTMYYYLSNEIVPIGGKVIVSVSGEHTTATVKSCKEYQEYEDLPYPYSQLRSIVSVVKNVSTNTTQARTATTYHGPYRAKDYYLQQLEDSLCEDSWYEDYDEGCDYSDLHDFAMDHHTGLMDEENWYYDMADEYYDDDMY